MKLEVGKWYVYDHPEKKNKPKFKVVSISESCSHFKVEYLSGRVYQYDIWTNIYHYARPLVEQIISKEVEDFIK